MTQQINNLERCAFYRKLICCCNMGESVICMWDYVGAWGELTIFFISVTREYLILMIFTKIPLPHSPPPNLLVNWMNIPLYKLTDGVMEKKFSISYI